MASHSNAATARRTRAPLGALAAALIGGALLGASDGRSRRRSLLRLVGTGLLAGAAIPALEKRVLGLGDARRRIRLRMTTEVHRPVGEVFAFLKDFENFPKLVGSLRRVIDYEDGRSHWEGYTPSGGLVAWDVVVTKYVPSSVIGWESVPGGDVDAAGLIRFAPVGPDSTRLDIELSYAPHATALGDALHALTGMRRDEQLEHELARASFYIESRPHAEEPSDAIA